MGYATLSCGQEEVVLSENLTSEETYTLLERTYGHVQWQPRRDPMSELIYTILSQHTSDINSIRAFESLIDHFGVWEEVENAEVKDIEMAIWAGGLARVKSQRIKDILISVRHRRGDLDLSFLGDMMLGDAKTWLMALPGVGPKTAAVVLCFALGMPAMPVDTHIYRVTKRLGLIEIKTTAEQAHDILEVSISPEKIFGFHVYLINHGREVCKALRPRCPECALRDKCPSASLVS
jgi:endonuclease-3